MYTTTQVIVFLAVFVLSLQRAYFQWDINEDTADLIAIISNTDSTSGTFYFTKAEVSGESRELLAPLTFTYENLTEIARYTLTPDATWYFAYEAHDDNPLCDLDFSGPCYDEATAHPDGAYGLCCSGAKSSRRAGLHCFRVDAAAPVALFDLETFTTQCYVDVAVSAGDEAFAARVVGGAGQATGESPGGVLSVAAFTEFTENVLVNTYYAPICTESWGVADAALVLPDGAESELGAASVFLGLEVSPPKRWFAMASCKDTASRLDTADPRDTAPLLSDFLGARALTFDRTGAGVVTADATFELPEILTELYVEVAGVPLA